MRQKIKENDEDTLVRIYGVTLWWRNKSWLSTIEILDYFCRREQLFCFVIFEFGCIQILWTDGNWFSSIIIILYYSISKNYVNINYNDKAFRLRLISRTQNDYNLHRLASHPALCAKHIYIVPQYILYIYVL